MFTTPTVVGDGLFVGSCSGVIYTFDRESGAVRWRYDTSQDAGPAQFHGDPAVAGDVVFTGSDGAEPSHFYAFRASTGDLLWKSELDVIESDVLHAAGLLVGRSFSGDLVALDARTGERRWRVRAEESRCGRRPHAPAVHGDVVVTPLGDRTITGVGLRDGAVRWRREVGCASSAVTVWRDAAYVGLGGARGKVLRLEPDTGELLAELSLGELQVHDSLVPVGDVLVAVVGEAVVAGLEPSLASIRWQHRSEGGVRVSSPRPLAYGRLALVGDSRGRLLALRSEDGSVAWSELVEGTVRGLGAHGDVVYVGTLGGRVYAYRPATPP
ncbi:MAG TPA: PQQ-binding-like beta-propeller repeat protein [Thermoanaerobaculia bacterium]|nr:PQQ-binding-like beta-propeller repeat protein [Thermoanaerobaculia bacterium]